MTSDAGGDRSGDRPTIALTLGDVAGTGPELVARAMLDAGVREWCRPIAVGHSEVLRRALVLLDRRADVVEHASFAEAVEGRSSNEKVFPCVNAVADDARLVEPGRVDPRAGRAAYDALVAAIDAASAGVIDAITTAPLNKAALHAAGVPFPGHTEILADRCGVADVAMMLYLPPGPPLGSPHGLAVAHATLHTSIASVPGLLTPERVRVTVRLVDRFLRDLGLARPRIGVCALNPHAGEDGLFGNEEATVVAPGVEAARADEVDATGPFPADTLLLRATEGDFDGVVAMYHDQGHVALKLLGFHRAVNVTLGLPIVRTSPSQGTAFDIAWRGVARPEGMIEAVRVAARLAKPQA